ncbi:MAG TPA: EamA family transporter RarD [Bacteriovoracaceae bacterium]|nr:EamA family transporter RarD [Bacteriovoracaceae bacterium]
MNFNTAHVSAFIAFSLWGLFPIYWKMLAEVPAWDLFGHRLLLSFVTLFFILTFRSKLKLVADIWRNPKQRLLLILSAGLISSNWLMYIYAVNTNRILEASMGYFMNPLFNVFMGRIILKEQLRSTQWPSIILAFLAMVIIAIQSDINHVPWLAILLSVSFAMYGLIRKVVHVGSMEGLAFETSVMIVPVLIAWFFQPSTPATVFSILPPWKLGLLATSGIVTSIPLILFAYSAKRLSFSTLGFFQYLSPSLKFVCGLLIFHEPLSDERLLVFFLIWIALGWYTAESYYEMSKLKRGR